MPRLRTLAGTAVVIAAGAVPLALPGVAVAGSQASSVPPHIVAKPNNVMVNTKTKLVGVGFPAHSTLTIKECSQKTWTVPQNPCDTTNTIQVVTDGRGRFHSKFTVQTCPAAAKQPGFAEICYIGEPVVKGVDQETLLGAAKITVTGP